MYVLRTPAEALRPFIEHYWFVTPDDAPVDLRVDVFVDGRADLIFNFGVPYRRQVIGGETVEYRQSNLDAQRLVPIRVIQSGHVHVDGVRFHLGGLAPFAVAPLAPFTGLTPEPRRILGDTVVALEHELRDLVDVDAKSRRLDAFFLSRLTHDPGVEAFQRALRLQTEREGLVSVEELGTAAGVSPRQLQRLFGRYLGMPPKTGSLVLRFQSALRRLMRDPGCTLADVATGAGYFDQAHFVRDFRRFSGGVPRGYRGYFPAQGPSDFAPNVVVFLQDDHRGPARD